MTHQRVRLLYSAAMEPVLPPFSVSPAAIGKIESLGGRTRVDLAEGGCSGSTYVFSTDGPEGTDSVYGCPGAELIVSAAAHAVLAGATLDYSDRTNPPRFRVIRNPNTLLRCPCNRSFGHQWPGRGQPDCRAPSVMSWDE